MFPACQPRNQTLHDITEIHHFFPLAKWLSGEIVIVSCTFLFWSSCHFLIQLIKGCVFCQGKYTDTSLLLTAEKGHKNFIKRSFYITASVLQKKLCLRISLCVGLIPLTSRRVLKWACEVSNYPNICLSAYVNTLLLKIIHICIFGLVVYIPLMKFICKHASKNVESWQRQSTVGSGAQEVRLIFLKSLYILLGAAPSLTCLRNVSHSISNNVLKNVRFCCNFNFDAGFQGKSLLNKKKEKQSGYFIVLS